MTFLVRELRRAKADKRHIFEWLHDRSRSGAIAWLSAYDRVIERLETSASSLDMDVKEALFKTRRGRIYRALFVIEGKEVFVLRVRGPGQAPVDATDLEGP